MEPGAVVALVTVLSNQEQTQVADLYPEVARLLVMFSFICTLLAHQGGWDEILWVLMPIAIMVWLLRVASQRVRRAGKTTSEASDVGAEGTESTH
jgi:hypothetical protein